jgi:aspartokinase
MLETSAVYWESIVRIYGFSEKRSLTLFNLTFPLHRLEYWSAQLQIIGEDRGCFELVFSQAADQNLLTLFIVLEGDKNAFARRHIERAAEEESGTSLVVDFPVEMISFHGPHFQDRYGIANVAFGVLASSEIRVLAAGCTGTSIYIVLPENMAGIAIQLLEKVFEVPQDSEIKIKN